MGEALKLPGADVEPVVTHRNFDDVAATRQAIYDNVLNAFSQKFPMSNDRYTLRLKGLKYRTSKPFRADAQKKAIMRGRTLGHNLVGSWELVDNKTQKVIDRTPSQLIAQVPYLTNRGTFIFNGSEYTISNQMRLRPGVYSRVKENGLIEAHFNVKGGTGPSFRVHMEPDSGVFRMHVGQANLKLYPILRALGIPDKELEQSWGRDLLAANVAASDPRAAQRAYHKLVRSHPSEEQMAKEAFGKELKSAVNYVQLGTYQQCVQCKFFNGMNGCQRVQGFVAPTGWCVLWTHFSKWASEKQAQDFSEGNRKRVKFLGELVCDDSKPDKPWAYLKVHKGLPEAAYQALVDQGVECEPRFDKPHISVLRADEVKQMKEKYGAKWKTACGNGRKFPFSLQNAMVDLDPEGWTEMDRVWFLEAKSPELRAYRKSLGLGELPTGNDSGKEFQFHITVAVKPHENGRGKSKIAAVFDGVEDLTKQASDAFHTRLLNWPRATFDPDAIVEDMDKLALAIDVSDPADETAETVEHLEGVEAQAQNDIKGNPGALAAKLRNEKAIREAQQARAATASTKLTATKPKREAESDEKRAFIELVGREAMIKSASDIDYERMRAVIEKMELDESTTENTLGKRVRNVSPELIKEVTQRLIAINRKEQETDDRDSLAFQQLMGPEELFAERVSRDSGDYARRALWRATFRGNVKHIVPGILSPQLRTLITKSGLAQGLEEINPLEVHDQQLRVTRMGEGGMATADSVPDEARNVQPSHFGYIDPVRAPEGTKVGVDSRATHGAVKGSDGNFYNEVTDARTGKRKLISAAQLTRSVVAFPGELDKPGRRVRAMVNGKNLEYVDRKDVDFALPSANRMFTITSNLVPMISSIKGGRLLMGAKMATQALPLQDGETPLVQNEFDDGSGRSFENVYGEKLGAARAKKRGVVRVVNKGMVTVSNEDGTVDHYDMYDNFPYNQKTYLHNTPAVKVGDVVKPGDLLAKSNYTNNEGDVALGKNLRVGYMTYKGFNADDAIVISEAAAKKLSSEHMYTTKFRQEDTHDVGKRAFVSIYPGRFDKKQMSTIDDRGLVKPGTVVKFGDPLVLAVSKRKPTGRGVLRGRKTLFSDSAEVWEHESPGVVTDVDRMKGGWKVLTKAYSPMQVGDKLANRYGGKGVVSRIIPDDQMPHDKDGNPLEIMLNPLGVVSRGNPAQLTETLLGKVAKKTGRPYKVKNFTDESYLDFAKRELQRHGLTDTEDLYDPTTRRKIPKVFTGHTYMMKLHHMAEKKASGREMGGYTSEGLPARGGPEGSKSIGLGELNALVSHGATNVIRDAKVVRGQRNDDYWRALRLGYPPPSPKVPVVYDKFLAHLQAAGINLKKNGDSTQLFAMTDDDVDKLSSGPITKAETVKGRGDMEPIKHGLFDVGRTGGHGGGRWSHIELATPMPNPVMEEPIRRLLGLTQKQFEGMISGEHKTKFGTGTKAIQDALKSINVETAIKAAKEQVREGTGAKRDAAVKRLGYLQTLAKSGIKPEQLMVTKVPVLPPNFRPITATSTGDIVSDANYLYVDLMKANEDYADLRKELGDDHTGDERLQLYHGFKAISGLGDPIAAKTQQKPIKGLLKEVFGGSPKIGMFQRRVLGAAVDTVGRGVITPNPSLNMDQVGLPEKKAWVIYRPHVMRKLVRRGMGAMAAAENIAKETDVARKALIDAMGERPVMISRAPALHRYSMMAFWPILTKGDTLQIPPIITPGFNADFDGDTMNYHVPATEDAVKDAVNKMLPSKNLRAVRDFDVHYYPRQEFLLGLHLASTAKKKGVKYFRSKQDAIEAYKRGEIGIDDQVEFK